MVGDILVNVVIVIAVTSLIGYLTSSALKSKPTIDAGTGARTFIYTRGLKVLALISLVMPAFMGAVFLSFYFGGESDYEVWLVTCLIFAAMSAYQLLEAFSARLIVSEREITSLSPWTGKRTFQWKEIDSIRYSTLSRWHIIVGPSGKKIYASDYLSGAAELSTEFRTRIPPEKWRK